MEKKIESIDILVTINQAYLEPLKVMLYSLRVNNPNQAFKVWLIYEDIDETGMTELKALANELNFQIESFSMNSDFTFPKSLLSAYNYPKEMYFRLLCANILPQTLQKVIYLDPDLLVINSIKPLWDLDLKNKMFAAAVHEGLTNLVSTVNNFRLGTDHGYFNSGIMVMDLEQMRQKVKVKDIENTIDKYHDTLILPDQDILNFLYGNDTLPIDEVKWNYDANSFLTYYARSGGEANLDWVMQNTSIIHFCGAPKPWSPKSDTRFTALFLNYNQNLKRRQLATD